MDWEKKFNSIIRDTDANLEKVKSRVLLTQRPSSSTPVKMSGSPSSPVGQAAPHAPSGIPPNIPGLAELFATVQKHTFELRQLAVQQRRHELENEYVKAELVRLRRDVKKLASGSSSSSSSSRSSAEPTPRPASTSAPRSSSTSASGPPPTTASTLPTAGPTALLSPSQRPAPVNFSAEISEEILRRMTRLEEKVTELQEQRLKEKMTPRSLLLGTSPLACVDDHFLVEADDVTPTENGRLAEPLGFNLDDLALSDSDDH